MAYCTAAQVKSLSYAIKAEVTRGTIVDADITALAALVADPVIDAALFGRVAPFTTVPTIVQMISALLTVAELYNNYFSHRDDWDSSWAGARKKLAMERLEDLQSGKLQADEITAPAMVAISDPTLDRPETETFTGDETTWEMQSEERE